MSTKYPEIPDPGEHDPHTSATLEHIAFYKFVSTGFPDKIAGALWRETAGLTGHILLAAEGINGVLAGPTNALDRFEVALTAGDNFARLFSDFSFKHSSCVTPPFARLKIHVKDEIVALGIKNIGATRQAGIDDSPREWRELIRQDDLVIIDNRNSFEVRLGRFKLAIDPAVDNFRDFSGFIFTNLPKWKKNGRRLGMYCTGGVQCQKSSAWMRDFDIPVYQLEGGILNYFPAMPGPVRDWECQCFVFDNRIALDTRLQETNTTATAVYTEPEELWRLECALRLGNTD